jgi:hypothetical protein
MKISKPTLDILNSTSPEEAIEIWGKDHYTNPLSEWSNKKFLEIIASIKKERPWEAIDRAIEIWEKYLIEEYTDSPNAGLASLRSAAWEWSVLYFEKIFSYHYDLLQCVINIENGVLDFQHKQPPRQHVVKIVESLKAIRLGKPSPFSKEEKEEIKNRFRGHCEKQGQQETYERYFGKSNQEIKFQ